MDKLLQTGSAEMKTRMETLLDGGNITVNIDEQIVFDQLEQNEDAVWSLLLAGGYLKVENLKYEGITREPWYTLSITNLKPSVCLQTCSKAGLADRCRIIMHL